MWQPHQFIRHLAEPQLKVSAFIYILIGVCSNGVYIGVSVGVDVIV